jgi:hypothetical protein
MFINGYKYQTAVLNLNNTDTLTIHNNTFRDNYIIDLIGIPSPDNRQANLYMAGTAVFDNEVFNLRAAPWSADATTIKLSGTGVERNYIEIPALWGTTTKVTDTGSGQSNTIKIITGGGKIAGTEAPITHTGGVSRIIDDRRGAEKAGATSVSDGGTIAHGLFSTPLWVRVTPSLANTIVGVTAKNATTFTVSLKTDAGAAGTTQTVYWEAGVYS